MNNHEMEGWPTGDSEMAAHIRAHDWAATPLGPIEGWAQGLRTMVGLVVESKAPMSLLWGRQAVQIYNDAYGQVIGERHPAALGRSALETFAEVRHIFEPQIERVWAGESVAEQDQHYPFIRHQELEDAWFAVSHNPVRDESGAVAGVLTIFTETTARVLAERQRAAIEATQPEAGARQGFLVGLSDMLRSIADPIAQQAAASRLLGEQLGASRVMYAEVEPDGRTLRIHSDYCRPGVLSVAGTHNLEDFGLSIADPLRAGERVIVEDYQALPGITASERAAYEALGLAAFIADPLITGGRLTTLISVHHAAPHAWTPLEIALIRETLERTGEAVERARAESALREREAQLRLALDIAELGIWAWDLASGAGYLDPRSAEIIGLAPGSLDNVAAAQLAAIHPDDLAGTQAQVEAGLASGESFDLSYRVVRPDRSVHYIASRARAFLDAAGRPIRLVGTNRDVTAERQAAARLRASEERFRLMADAVPQIVWLTDADGRTEFFNKQWSDYTGAPYEPTTAAEVATHFLHPEDAAPTMAAFDQARQTGNAFIVEHRIRSAAGAYRWFLVRAEPYRDPQTGQISRWFGASIDIHDRKEAEARLRKSEQRYRTLFDSIDEGFCIIQMIFDEDGAPVDYRFLAINPAFERQTGLRDALGKTVRESVPGIEPHWPATYGAVALSGRPLRFVDHSPSLGRWFDVYAFPVDAPAERKVALLFTDISERKRAEAALRDALAAEQAARSETEAALKAREQFLSIASHELRTPLTSLLGSADMLRRTVARGQAVPERTLERIVRQAQRMDRLINQLLDVSRLQQGQFALECRPLDLAELTAHVVDEFRAALPPTGAHPLELSRPEQPVMLMGDAQRLEQVLENLLSNAVKYSPGGGPVRVRVSSSDHEALIEVSDAGIGIPAAAHEQVFAPFYRAANVGAQVSGFGIGLYVVAEIIRRHAGQIMVASQEGLGSTFRVSLPLSAQS